MALEDRRRRYPVILPVFSSPAFSSGIFTDRPNQSGHYDTIVVPFPFLYATRLVPARCTSGSRVASSFRYV